MTSTADHPLPLRLVPRPAPPADGPYDDEQPEAHRPVVDGALALAFPPPTRSAVPLRLLPPAGGVDHDPPQVTAPRPDPRGVAGRLTQAIAEVLAGDRPACQLSDVATLDVLRQLERGAGRLAGHRHTGVAQRPRLLSVHLSQPRPGVAEVCGVVDTGPRRRALAIRLEARRSGWVCTTVQVG